MKKALVFLLLATLLLSSCQREAEAGEETTAESTVREAMEAELERLGRIIEMTDMKPSYQSQ